MSNKIFEYSLPPHFIQRGWERGIDEALLTRILPFVNEFQEGKSVVIVTPSFLSRKQVIIYSSMGNLCLVLILKPKTIITGFMRQNPNYLFKQEKNAHFQLLY